MGILSKKKGFGYSASSELATQHKLIDLKHLAEENRSAQNRFKIALKPFRGVFYGYLPSTSMWHNDSWVFSDRADMTKYVAYYNVKKYRIDEAYEQFIKELGQERYYL